MKLDKRLLGMVRGLRLYLAATVGFGVLAGLLAVVQALTLSTIINAVFLAGHTLAQLVLPLALLLGAFVLRATLLWGSDVTANHVAGQVKTRLRAQLLNRLFALGPNYVRRERSGELAGTFVSGVEALHAYFNQYIPQLFLTILVPLIVLIAVAIVDPLSGLILFLSIPILPIFMMLIGWMAEASTKKQWRLLSLMSAHFLDVLQGLTTLKLFRRSTAQRETIRRISDAYRETTMKVLRIAFLSALVMEMGATLSVAIIAVEIGVRLVYGHMAFQPALSALLLAPEFYLPLRTLGTRFHAALNSAAAGDRIFEILATPATYEQQSAFPRQAQTALTPLRTLSFEDVSYAYEEQRPILQHVSLTIEAGEKIALVGENGAGKSTLASLLLRFIEPEQGVIRVNGLPLSAIPVQEWRAHISWVPQLPYLFQTTITENIRLGKPDASMAEIRQAAEQAQLADWIATLPQGYETLIGEQGARVSGGQRQRIALARAFLKNAPLLILDEPSSHLDAGNEERVLDAVDTLMQGRTVLLITHHAETLKHVDRVLTLEHGRPREQTALPTQFSARDLVLESQEEVML